MASDYAAIRGYGATRATPGDAIELQISGIGTLFNCVVAEE